MTGVPATGAKAFAVNLPAGAVQKNVPNNMEQSFADIMNMNGRESRTEAFEDAGKVKSPVSASGTEKRISKEKISKETADSGKPAQKLTEEEAVQLEEAAGKLKEEIADALDVTVEELEAAMETLGLSFADLLNPVSLAGLVAEMSAELDGLDLVTDAALFEGLKELSAQVTATVEELAFELGIKPEEMVSMLEEAFDNVEAQAQLENELHLKEPAAENGAFAERLEASATEQADRIPVKDFTAAKDLQDKAAAAEETGENSISQKEGSAIEVDTAKQQTASEDFQNKGSKSESHRSFGQEGTGTILPQAVFAEGKTAPLEMEAPLPAIDPQSILNQIGEAVRVTGGEDFTSMEMQLHPESLGTLHLQVRAKEGIITAQFTAESEAVKQVLEAQVIQLREKLEAQGVKVEAVEVLVASHEFERNLEKGGSEEKNAYQAKKVTRRKINLNVPEEDPDLPEEEKEALDIQKDMMERSGNTLDYMA